MAPCTAAVLGALSHSLHSPQIQESAFSLLLNLPYYKAQWVMMTSKFHAYLAASEHISLHTTKLQLQYKKSSLKTA
jgi:hypothetical protein